MQHAQSHNREKQYSPNRQNKEVSGQLQNTGVHLLDRLVPGNNMDKFSPYSQGPISGLNHGVGKKSSTDLISGNTAVGMSR
jgi:hypothetical protein